MYEINFRAYETLANELMGIITSTDYYSGVIEFDQDGTSYKFITSLIIYHDRTNSEGDAMLTKIDAMSKIASISPVWQEMTTTINGVEETNDFDFKILRNIIYKCNY